jgi:hypothetical protein
MSPARHVAASVGTANLAKIVRILLSISSFNCRSWHRQARFATYAPNDNRYP